MKHIHTYIKLIICASIILSSCTRIEENNVNEIKTERFFTATIDDNTDTKTIIDGELGDEYRKTLWLPGDSIAVTTGNYSTIEKFVNISTDTTDIGIFKGEIPNNSSYYAIYPYNSARIENDSMFFYIPEKQKYYPNSFSPEAAPMFARTYIEEGSNSSGSEFTFTNLCGVLVLNLTGEECVKSITFMSKGEDGSFQPISGRWSVNITYQGSPTITRSWGSSNAVTIDCGQEGVQLDNTNPTPFYMVLPPSTYSSFIVSIATTDGKIMLKEGTNPLTITRANVTKASSLEYTESIDINLSERGTSNCYLITKPGIYSLDASTIGNGDYGLAQDVTYHTTNTKIEPTFADVLWMDHSSLISNATYDSEKKTISFLATGVKGNALIAARDADSTILWSWHIWCTDKPVDHTYVNGYGVYSVMDRNLGAIRADRGGDNQWRESTGTLYQWGRKDPMLNNYTTSTNTQFTIEESILYPTQHASNYYWIKNEETMPENGRDSKLWLPNKKTIYDPCPVGYRVAPIETFKGFTKDGQQADRMDDYNVDGTFDKGWNFIYDGTNTAWYPCTGYISDGGWFNDANSIGYVRSSTYHNNLYYHYSSDLENKLSYSSYGSQGDAIPVRCIKDGGYIDTSLPTVTTDYATDIITDGATLNGNILSAGESEIISKGFVWSTSHLPTIDLETKVEIEGTDSEFQYSLSGLSAFTTYYVRAYATNGHGTAYGKEVSFTTLYTGAITDLSLHGTANCYIVTPEEAHYSIDASVIGNGAKGIISDAYFHTDAPNISPVAMKIIWQDAGHPIDFADFHIDGEFIHFHTSGSEGNAVLAALDADGTILWSWHIWVTDTPANHQYSSGYTMMDRNLGATRADRGSGEEWKESCGLEYQWGRKDPFAGYYFTESSDFEDIESSIKNPNVYLNNWKNRFNNTDLSSLWLSTQKTIYDPCPSGYIVAHSNAWSNFSVDNVHGEFDNGYNFIYDASGNYAWYPNKARGHNTGIDYWGDAYMYTANSILYLSHYDIYIDSYSRSSERHQVRCMKDEGYVDAAIPAISIEGIANITTSSADINCLVSKQGGAEISARGILLGQSPELTLENTTPITSEGGIGEFTVSLSDLSGGNKYYVRAYATNEYGTAYSKVINFTTEYGGSYINLSTFETANSYIVSTANRDYCFNASVKGNSNTSIGTPASAEVIWETKNSSESVTQCEVIKEVALDGVFVTFSLPETPVAGNALIAVKDGDGNILWSWHIWVTDFDPKATAQTYMSGAVMMDRNLGALSTVHGSVKSFGLMYQWGRKDPFVACGDVENNTWAATYPAESITSVNVNNDSNYNTQDYATKHPNTIIWNSDWNQNNNLWGNNKTQYDPCPPGWKIPSGEGYGVWDGWSTPSEVSYGRVFGPPYSIPQTYIPLTGTGDFDGEELIHTGYAGRYWSNNVYLFTEFWYNNINILQHNSQSSLFSVRCQNIEMERFIIGEMTTTQNETNNNVIVEIPLTVTKSGKSFEKGFLWSTTESVPIFGKGTKVNVTTDDFKHTLKDLTPGTTYYITPFVYCDGIYKYGTPSKFTTYQKGDNEDINKDDDEYEW